MKPKRFQSTQNQIKFERVDFLNAFLIPNRIQNAPRACNTTTNKKMDQRFIVNPKSKWQQDVIPPSIHAMRQVCANEH